MTGNNGKLSGWLSDTPTVQADGKYEHLLLRENAGVRQAVLPDIKGYFRAAHDDALRRLKALAYGDLDPLKEDGLRDPTDGYPLKLHPITLQGYFGEVMAAYFAEYFGPFGHKDWVVPAHLFRDHIVAFQHLERMTEVATDPKAETSMRPGRTGDDCVAFRRSPAGKIIATLFCEAKCTPDHDAQHIADGHEKLSEDCLRPVDLLQIIEVLTSDGRPDALQWVNAIRELYHGRQPKEYARFNQFSYVYGRAPKRVSQTCWIDAKTPHAKYAAAFSLRAVEVHLDDLEALIREAHTWS